MATQPAVVRVLILPILNNSTFSENGILNNSVIMSAIQNAISPAAVLTYVSIRTLSGGVYGFTQAVVIEITTTTAGDATIVTNLPTLQTNLGLANPIPTWSYAATWGY